MPVSICNIPREELTLDLSSALGDPRELRRAFGRFPTGVTVITTQCANGKREGITANSFTTVSLDPPLVLWSLRNDARSRPGFQQARHFAIHVLAREQRGLSTRFATPAEDKFEGLDIEEGLGGCPLLPACLARFECETQRVIPAGDHLMWLGRVIRVTHAAGDPLVFNAGRLAAVAELEI